MNRNKVGLTLGAMAGLCHLVWALLVATGQGQPLMDWMFKMHFLNNPYTVGAFDAVNALLLVVMALVMGYIVGFVFTSVWDMVHKK
jgi:hypothetical protein